MREPRRRSLRLALAVGMAAFIATASAPAAETREKKGESPHVRKDAKGCIVCHLAPPAESPASSGGSNLRFGGDVLSLCSSCHGGYKHMHPVKIVVPPEMKSPEDLPLDKDGKITCITCHDVMADKGVHRRRRVVGRDLCLNCHPDSDILAQVNWYPTRLKGGESGRLELKVVEFRLLGKKGHLGDSMLLYYYAKDVDSGDIVFGTGVLHDDGTNGDRVPRDSVYTLIEKADKEGRKRRVVYTAWVINADGRRSNTVTLAVEYE